MNSTEYVEIEAGYVYSLQSMFYLLLPHQTYFKAVADVPNVVSKSSNFFLGFVLLEYLLLIIKHGWGGVRMNDNITSVSAGLISRFPEFFSRSITLTTYVWIYERFCIYELPWNSFLTYIVAFLGYDMGYYWFHRAAHEVNLFWAAHQVHHSSEDYNLTTALRQSIAQVYTSWIFYLPLALFVPPSIFTIHSYMNLLYQFWIHTEIIENLGPIEWIFNTPSHHRVHHGRNAYCIDKNYAGVLIIWDRIFGTFEAEKKDEKIAYGLVHNIHTFNPFYIQFFHFKYIFEKFFEANSWQERFGILFKGPGWRPGLPRLGDNIFPEIENPIQKYDPKLSSWLNIYLFYNFVIVFIVFGRMLEIHHTYTTYNLLIYWGLILFSLYSCSTILDQKSYAVPLECLRCIVWIAYDYYDVGFFQNEIFQSISILYILYKIINILSLLLFTGILLSSVKRISISDKKQN